MLPDAKELCMCLYHKTICSRTETERKQKKLRHLGVKEARHSEEPTPQFLY